MNSELTNLLPEERTRGLRRTYFVRLASVSVNMLTILVVITGVLLIPAYVFLQTEIQTRTQTLAHIESTLASADEVALEARLSQLGSNTDTLNSLSKNTSATTVMRNVLAVPRAGIALSGFSYTPPQGLRSGQIIVNGLADSRNDLRAYQLALLGSSFVKSADLPISAFASDTNIGFSITITLSTNS